jgi:RimJ/RimL family protein N-acetyltransferase
MSSEKTPAMNFLITGDNVYLRRITPADATPEYVAWLNDEDTTRYLESGGGASLDSVKEYIDRYVGRDDVAFLAIVLRSGDRHVGNIKFEPVDRKNGRATLGIMIGDPNVRGKGIGTEAMILAMQYAFDNLGLHRLELGVTSDNVAALRCYERVGFKKEGVLREAVRRENGRVDSVWMAILVHEFQALHGGGVQ